MGPAPGLSLKGEDQRSLMRRRDGEPERQHEAAVVSVRLPPGDDLPLQLSASLFVQLRGGTRKRCAVHVLPEEVSSGFGLRMTRCE